MSSPERNLGKSVAGDLSIFGGDDELPVKIKPEYKKQLSRTQVSITIIFIR